MSTVAVPEAAEPQFFEAPLDLRYEDVIRQAGRAEFVAIVIHGVRRVGTDILVNDEDPQFFAVYLRKDDSREKVCVGEHAKVERAEAWATALQKQYGWIIVDLTCEIYDKRPPLRRMAYK
jgi:hypothetical protein